MPENIKPVAVMCFSSGTGGMERSAVRLAGFLASLTDVILVCKLGSFTEDLYNQERPGCRCETIRFSSRVFSPSMLVSARAIMARHDIGNVIFFGASELKTLYFAFLGGAPNLIVWHGTTKSRPKHDFVHRLVYSRVNYHVAISKHLQSNVRRIVPPTQNVEFRVVYPSFRIETRGKLLEQDVSAGPLRLVHIGRVAAGKGQIDAVQACAPLYAAGIEFRLDLVGSIGNDAYSRELKELVNACEYKNQVVLAGFVEDPRVFLEQADLFLFPSFGEGMPNAFIEALHYGLPCLAYANTVFPEFISMGFHVKLAADRDQRDLANTLLAMVENIEEEKQASEGNANLARKRFNVERELADWKAILK